MPQGLTVKNVENALKFAHKSRRRVGNVPYPVIYTKEMADFDMWDHMFLTGHFQGLTQHKFNSPPSVILDLGCGSGYWAIEAAKQWQSSVVIGYDICELQPRLDDVEHLQNIARRVKWVHGNFLDGLPFPSNHFDFVRMAGLGLAIPEDEWQSVLEEVNRVMKPMAVLEIIVEDLIFPTPSSLLQIPTQSPVIPSAAYYPEPLDLIKTKSTTLSNASQTPPSASPTSPMGSLSSLIEPLKRRNRSSIFQPSSPVSDYPSSSLTSFARPPPPSTNDIDIESDHPQDHTRLKQCWDAMLSARFLSSKVVSIIPFYLTSTFADTKSFPPLVIPLPPNSGSLPSLKSYQSLGNFKQDRTKSNNFLDMDFDFERAPLSNRSIKADGFSFRSSIRYKPQAPTWSPVHLTKTLCTIRSCREAIWKEYDRFYRNEAMDILVRITPPEEEHDPKPLEYAPIIAFEMDWQNWEYDMLDRTGMRDHLAIHIPWVQAATEDEAPPHMKWRRNLDPDSDPKHRHLVVAYNPNDICRSLRVFTAFKSP